MLDRSLVGPISAVVKVATLQEYGVDKFFILENNNVDASQRNVIFIARGECGRQAEAISGKKGPQALCGSFTSSNLLAARSTPLSFVRWH